VTAKITENGTKNLRIAKRKLMLDKDAFLFQLNLQQSISLKSAFGMLINTL
jgi:hypothetical protein